MSDEGIIEMVVRYHGRVARERQAFYDAIPATMRYLGIQWPAHAHTSGYRRQRRKHGYRAWPRKVCNKVQCDFRHDSSNPRCVRARYRRR